MLEVERLKGDREGGPERLAVEGYLWGIGKNFVNHQITNQ